MEENIKVIVLRNYVDKIYGVNNTIFNDKYVFMLTKLNLTTN